MRRITKLLVASAAVTALATSCGGGSPSAASTTSAPAGPTTTRPETDTTRPSTETTVGGTVAPTMTETPDPGGAIPASCAEGFAEYLQMAEPLVEAFDRASGSLGELKRYEGAVGDGAYEMLVANDSYAPYSCSEIGLEWAYFDARSPWNAVLAFAEDRAPGTVAYLTALRDLSATQVQNLGDLGVAGCEDAVARIKQEVADQKAAGNETLAHTTFPEGLQIFAVYQAYMTDVRNEACPRDQLGNDEWGFMIETLPNG